MLKISFLDSFLGSFSLLVTGLSYCYHLSLWHFETTLTFECGES